MKEKKIKIIIILVFIISLILTLLISFFQKNDNIEEENNDTAVSTEEEPILDMDEETVINKNYTLSKVSSVEEYFNVKGCINKYFQFVNYLNIDDQYDYTEEAKKELRKENIEQMYVMLDKEYIDEFNITVDKLSEMYKQNYDVEFLINEMYRGDLANNISVYVIYGKYIESKDSYNVKEYGVIIKLDKKNHTFSIYLNDFLKEENYLELGIGDTLNLTNEDDIENQDYNVYEEVEVNTQSLVEYYFQLYKRYLNVDLDYSYELLDSTYKTLRFGNIDEYKEYMNSNLEILNKYVLSKYKVLNYSAYTQIICLDEEKNYYVFNVTKPGEFTVLLDNYTVVLGTDEATYEEAFPNSKCSFNVDRFIKGINNKNYNFSYSVLANSFKISKYPTKEKFVEYIQERLFDQNKVESIQWTMTDEEIYTGLATIVDATGESSKQISMTFRVDLKSGTNFELSFTEEK